MGSCYSGDHNAEDHMHTIIIACSIEEPQQKYRLGTLLSKLYLDTAEGLWNGNKLKGKDAVIKFYEDLPTSEHKLESLDAQPISGDLFPGQLTIMVKTFGTVQFPNNNLKAFHQVFMLTSQNNVWKIVSDNFRFQDKSES